MVDDRFVILMEPEIAENTGFIARLCDNFDYGIRLVNPDFNLEECRKTASNSQQILRDAQIFSTLEDAIEDLEFVIGTKPGRGSSLSSFDVNGFESIVLGRESRGLSNSELDLCDAVVHIETGGFDSLNLSHAASVLMHSFYSRGLGKNVSGLSEKQKGFLEDSLGSNSLLKELILRGNPTSREFDRLVGELKDIS